MALNPRWKMRTWQVIHGAGDTFRWESSGQELEAVPEDDERVGTLSSPLPSMAELLLQECSKIVEENEQGSEIGPMFKTGFGRSVSIKQSSIATALSVLGGDCATDSVKQSLIAKGASDKGDDSMDYTAQVKARNSGCNFSNTLFQTGSGKMVNVSSKGLARAKTLLGFQDDNNQSDFHGFQDTKKLPDDDLHSGWQNSPNVESIKSVNHYEIMDDASIPRSSSACGIDFDQNRLIKEASSQVLQPRMGDSATKPTPVKFHTAGGKSISISGDALQRAKSLLGDPELGAFLDVGEAVMDFSFSKNKEIVDTSLNKENGPFKGLSRLEMDKDMFETMNKSFVSPLLSYSKKMLAPVTLENLDSGSNVIGQFNGFSHHNVNRSNGKVVRQLQPNPSIKKLVTPYSVVCNTTENGIGSRKNLESLHSGCNLIGRFDEVSHDNVNRLNGKLASQQQTRSSTSKLIAPNAVVDSSAENGIGLRNLGGKFQGRQLTDISNTVGTNEKRRLLGASVSPFKRPRSSKFCTPMKSNVSFAPNGVSTFSSNCSRFKEKVSFRYPFPATRMYIREYFGVPPSENKLENMVYPFGWIKPDNAEKYMFADDSGVKCIGVEAFFKMLAGLGVSDHYASKEWVKNHYKWIVWKLACYETYYPTKCGGKFLTVSNVLEELKYRYEREVNHGHRSAIKRILEGDASPTSMMVLCVSAICRNNDLRTEGSPSTLVDSKNHSATTAKVELTDGWYSLDAILDTLLLQQLASGKLFVGQKLRIWGAGLCGWVGPVSPLEVSRTVNLVLHINGTYRAHWADRLGLCKGVRLPLAFKCIKSNGGAVPLTLVGITRIYPLLFKERLNDGRSLVRSERMENRVMQSYNQRRSVIIDGIVSEFQRHSHTHHDSDSEEGAKILNILEKASEPEILLAEMSPDQINSFAKYQAKMEAIRQSDLEKSIEKSLEDSGLSKREVNPFMRVRVVGLTSKTNDRKEKPKVGLVTIWNPTEKQHNELVEGKAYIVAGLLPTNTAIDTDTTYLQSRESTSWKPLSLQEVEHFKPFFTPRKSVFLSNLGEVPLSSEFDVAAFVIFVGDVYSEAHQMKQWVFVTDSSVSVLYSQELSDCLLAICFCSPYVDDDSFVPFSHNLVGSTVGFCNLIKRPKDQMNHLWVAEASENSSYFLSFDTSHCSHLKEAALSAEKWGKLSHLTADKLREKVLFIIGDGKSSQ